MVSQAEWALSAINQVIREICTGYISVSSAKSAAIFAFDYKHQPAISAGPQVTQIAQMSKMMFFWFDFAGGLAEVPINQSILEMCSIFICVICEICGCFLFKLIPRTQEFP